MKVRKEVVVGNHGQRVDHDSDGGNDNTKSHQNFLFTPPTNQNHQHT